MWSESRQQLNQIMIFLTHFYKIRYIIYIRKYSYIQNFSSENYLMLNQIHNYKIIL